MKLRALWSLIKSGRWRLLTSIDKLLPPFYQVYFAWGAHQSGLLKKLSPGPLTFETLSAEFPKDPSLQEALFSWLQFGVRIGELKLGRNGYRLRGKLSKGFADPQNDFVLGFFEELLHLHSTLIIESPTRLKEGHKFSLGEWSGPMVARSSRILEPFVFQAIDDVIPSRGAVQLLEIGCGAGTYIRYAANKNPELTAVGIELQEDVAHLAQSNIRQWKLDSRVSIAVSDFRDFAAEPLFDMVTMHNMIYYLPKEARILALKHVKRFLKPGGKLLLTTCCQGGSLGIEFLHLWVTMTEGCGPLPTPRQTTQQLKAAGFASVTSKKLIFNDSYYAFVGTLPS